ncbi:hypothetical protein NDU88_003641 [Pleurodeles waltl]|uniref:Uncharacterized protein n=1 Tax=Pleurodeles waltl TaxID=8319 RepID=A0AAV7T5N5_PLEWA|nr:hypothetical protein NDU88_003641 [Pleurodeles waltl]
MPRQDAQSANSRPGAAPVLHGSHGSRPAQPGRGQVGGRGAPAAAPKLESSRLRRTAIQASQPRLHSNFTGESDGAAPMPRVHRTHLGQASLFFGSGHQLRPAPSNSTGQSGTSCCGSKFLGATPGPGGEASTSMCSPGTRINEQKNQAYGRKYLYELVPLHALSSENQKKAVNFENMHSVPQPFHG